LEKIKRIVSIAVYILEIEIRERRKKKDQKRTGK